MKLSTFRSNEQAENEGVWVPIGGDAKMKIARWGNPKFEEAMRKVGKPYQYQISAETLDDDTAKSLMVKVMAQTILLDWEKIEGENGEPLQYSTAQAERIMSEYPEIFRLVKTAANDISLFRSAAREEAAKN